ncbi:hypothetical protein AVEN_254627-1 [Araneus ventricosus]|uniref:ATP-dependent DNA helicase n=1 Tax=Araneus ventricosus TaxID=182803 RepID=A0A4Y2GCG5_ARAVE|nr:hypothetical protein AVEN_254627-1 [Araneus ventricosus]
MRPTSPEADKLRQAVLIIIDEITMLTKDGLCCIDSLLRDLMNNDKPFGSKVIIIKGDFRQTPPIVARGLQCDFIEIPQQMVVEKNLIEDIYSKNLNGSRTTNKACYFSFNQQEDTGNESVNHRKTFYSSDSIISEDQNDLQNSPPEFPHDLTLSGIPPHALMLKKGVIAMLLRNLNPKQGLCNGTHLSIAGLHENFVMRKSDLNVSMAMLFSCQELN